LEGATETSRDGVARTRPPASRECLACGGETSRPLFEKGGRRFLRCPDCGYVRLEPLPTVEELEAHYAWTYAEGPYAVFAAADDVRAFIARDRLVSLGASLPEGPWLDVGASTGAFVRVAREAGRDARGIELSEAAVDAARMAGLPVERARIEDWEPAEPLAAVTAFDVIEHLLDPRVLPERARRWLRPGGVLALTLPDIGSPVARAMGRHWFFYAPNDHFHYFDRASIARFLGRHGFRVERVATAAKPLTPDYVAGQIEVFYPPLAAASRLVRLLPRGLRERTIHVPVGEMLVVARRSEA
jgi:SAM-dependent methyltransferase